MIYIDHFQIQVLIVSAALFVISFTLHIHMIVTTGTFKDLLTEYTQILGVQRVII